ncbi:Nucleoid-associated protein Lsr2 [Streptomyces hundungensis]|uniref:Nucleoid-associated protein Lsr2 n=1 Tax=Streptomyces hundungensis TaxID=1077946 RepID=A0A387HCL6_9ACTN|nr:Nucleoid-associated protein Lsr2 [Streptomyces hundungensis]
MARKVLVVHVDDLDGTESAEPGTIRTITFGLDGASFEIDLTGENEAELRTLLAPYMAAGRRTQGQAGGLTTARPRKTSVTSSVRAWAREHGYEVNDRGRVPESIQVAYLKAMDGSAAVATPATISRADVIESEEEAAKHYEALPAPEGHEKRWHKRTGSGCERTNRIEDMTLLERVHTLTAFNLNVLGQMTGDRPTGKGGKISGLGTSAVRLRNFEFIDDDDEITAFGRYAYAVRS